jgi:uncharacterized membrane protein YesL
MTMTDRRDTQPSKPRRPPSIQIAFRTLGRTLRHGYDNLGVLFMVSFLWFVGAILIVPLGPVTAALHRVTKPMSEERATNWRNFFDHLRADLRWSSALAFTLLLGFVVLLSNITFYNASSSPILQVVAIPIGAVLLVWIGIALVAFPLVLRQEELRLRTTLRNAVVLVMTNAPGLLISYVLLLLLILLLLFLPPLSFLIPGVVALWGQENARLLLVAGGHIAPDEIADQPKQARKR